LTVTPQSEDSEPGFQNTTFTDGILKGLSIHGKAFRIEVDQGYASYKSFEMSDPPRLVIDFIRKAPQQAVTPAEQPQEKQPPPVLLPPAAPTKKVVVIDPGHGGAETGAAGQGGALEKDITLSIGRKLKAILESTGVRVILTRDSDRTVPLDDRTALAN